MSSDAKPDRLPPIPEAAQTPAQRTAAAELIEGPRGGLRGPFIALLRSPELLARTQRLGEYLRYRSVIPQRLRELAILATARHWRQSYEWHAHAPIAAKAGVPQELIDALGRSGDAQALAADERNVLQFCLQLHRTQTVGDPLFAQVRALLGEDGVVELCGLCGYYALLAMVLNVARTPAPEGTVTPFESP